MISVRFTPRRQWPNMRFGDVLFYPNTKNVDIVGEGCGRQLTVYDYYTITAGWPKKHGPPPIRMAETSHGTVVRLSHGYTRMTRA